MLNSRFACKSPTVLSSLFRDLIKASNSFYRTFLFYVYVVTSEKLVLGSSVYPRYSKPG
jgi:hypothetical protein